MSYLLTPPRIFLQVLHKRGLSLSRDGDILCLNGPQEKRTDSIRRYLRERKADIIAFFTFLDEVEAELPSLALEAEAEMSQIWQRMVQNAYQAALAEEFPDALHFTFPFGGCGRWLSGPHKDLYHLEPVNLQFSRRYSFLKWAKSHFVCYPHNNPSIRYAEEIITTLTLYWVTSAPLTPPPKGNTHV